MTDPLTDTQIYDVLHQSLAQLRGHSGQTKHGEATLKAAVKTLATLQLALVMIEAKAEQTLRPPDPAT